MSVSVGELFVNLGIKGSEKTLAALDNTKKGMSGLASMSLEAKAGIVGAMYALERLFAASGAAGTNLTNFNALIGMSAKELQTYQNAARQVGVSNESMAGTFKGLQSQMTKVLTGGAPPQFMAMVSRTLGNITNHDILKFQKDPKLLFDKLQEYALKEKNVGLRNEALKSFGIGDDVAAGMARGGFTQSALSKATKMPTYNENEIASLDRANIAWANLGNKIEMAVGHFNAKHGGQLVQDISKITDQVIKLVEAFMKLAETLKLFKWAGKVFEGWNSILGGVNKGANAVNGAINDPKKRGQLGEDVKGFFTELPGVFRAMMEDITGKSLDSESIKKMIEPYTPAVGQAAGNTQNTTVNQTLNFQHDGKDAKRTGDSVKQAVQHMVRTNPAVRQGS